MSSQILHTSAKKNLSGSGQNLMGTFLSEDTCVIKCSWKSDHSLWRYKPNCGKGPVLQFWRTKYLSVCYGV